MYRKEGQLETEKRSICKALTCGYGEKTGIFEKKRLENKLEKISWKERVKNEEVIGKINEERNIIVSTRKKKSKLDWSRSEKERST